MQRVHGGMRLLLRALRRKLTLRTVFARDAAVLEDLHQLFGPHATDVGGEIRHARGVRHGDQLQCDEEGQRRTHGGRRQRGG